MSYLGFTYTLEGTEISMEFQTKDKLPEESLIWHWIYPKFSWLSWPIPPKFIINCSWAHTSLFVIEKEKLKFPTAL